MNIELEKIVENVRIVDANRRYWFIRTYGGITFRDFSDKNYVGIGFNKVPYQLLQNAKPGEVDAFNKLKEYILNNSEYKGGVATRWANQLITFQHRIKKGDLVIIPEKDSKFYSIGVVESDVYVVDDTRTFEHNNDYIRFPEKRRKIKWEKSLTKQQIRRDLPFLSSNQQAITNVNRYGDRLEAYISSIFIKEDRAYLTLRVEQDEDINAFAFRDFLNGLTYFYEEFCKEFGYENNEELYIKIKVQSKGKLALQGFAIAGILAIGTLIAFSNDSEFEASIKGSNFKFKTDGLIKTYSEFLNEDLKRKIIYEKFKDSMNALKVKRELSLEKDDLNDSIKKGEENNRQDNSK
jgi:hypothetical protein